MSYKISIFFFMLSIMAMGCENSGEKRVTDNIHRDSIALVSDTNKSAPVAVVLKEMEVNSNAIPGNNNFFRSRVLDENEINRLSLRIIDSTAPGNEATFKYHVVDTMFSSSRARIILIGREYPEENILWLAIYDSDSNLVDRLMVYYDNSEGSMQVRSVIKQNEVEVKTLNDYAESSNEAKKIALYRVAENNTFVKIR